MLDEAIDPRPSLEAALAAVLGSEVTQAAAAVAQNIGRLWDDRQNEWANLRNMQYWLERGR